MEAAIEAVICLMVVVVVFGGGIVKFNEHQAKKNKDPFES